MPKSNSLAEILQNVDLWTFQHVARFIREVDQGTFAEVACNFEKEKITGRSLQNIKLHHLKRLGVRELGPRLDLYAKIRDVIDRSHDIHFRGWSTLGPPRDVRVRVKFQTVSHIDLPSHTFTADVHIGATWRDEVGVSRARAPRVQPFLRVACPNLRSSRARTSSTARCGTRRSGRPSART